MLEYVRLHKLAHLVSGLVLEPHVSELQIPDNLSGGFEALVSCDRRHSVNQREYPSCRR